MDSGRTREQRQFRIAFGAVAAVLFVLWLLSGRSEPSGTTEPKSKGPTESECRTDLQCWARKFEIDAKYACKPKIDRMASWDVKWEDGFLTPTFTRIRWLDEKAGTLTFYGDKVRFQNGFGAFRRMTYACDYDTSAKAVLDVRLREGALPD